ncbi:hypothetical protein [Methylocystis echinoides]|uniref:Uncharacterized protein n=1 Tax=Methylocystis echinoides TaxID=29468 RepID=A0A9W6GUA7_9HYPH|nr:hypothetical protein [Methylocystis echinoides]GLI92985.1 hypothetical protein LMG27198_19770 [Methylocystis echinoides]
MTARQSLPRLIAVLWRIRLARLMLWLARVSDYDASVMSLARRLVDAAERGMGR